MVDSFREKTQAIFEELLAARGTKLERGIVFYDLISSIENAQREEIPEAAHDIAFHLADWYEDGAFLVALQLFPERFTADEVRDGVRAFLIHAPNHIAAAAHLAGWPISDVFRVGLKLDTPEPRA